MTLGPAGTWVRRTCQLVVVGLCAALLAACSDGDGEPGRRCAASEVAQTGVFRQTDATAVEDFERWLGCRVDVVVDFGARDTWEDVADPGYLLDAWDDRPWVLALSVPMLPEQEEASIEAGASGAYDGYFTRLADALVEHGRGDSILRIGWEFNLPESRWFTEDSAAFRTYWRRIVAAMSVPGSDFVFEWNPNNGSAGVDATAYYPGDDVVDDVAVDAYDVDGQAYPYPADCSADCRAEHQRAAWEDEVMGGPRGLSFWRDFAAGHGKPMSVPEWGLWDRPDGIGGGANPVYLRGMLEFLHDPANNVRYQAYFEHDGADGEHRLMTTFSQEATLFRRYLNAETPAPSP